MAQPDIRLSPGDLQLVQQHVAANLAAHPYFVELVKRHIPEGTATKSELAQVCEYASQGVCALRISAPALPCLL